MAGNEALEYRVVVNHEEQYSIWPSYKDRPRGWDDAGKRGSKDECLAWIEQVWTDMRPKSLRTQAALVRSAPLTVETDESERLLPSLVERLAQGEHPVVVSRAKSAEDLALQLERGYVHLLFVGTQGGTELGFQLDAPAPGRRELSDSAQEVLQISGRLQVDFESVQIVARIDPATLHGAGRLVRSNGAMP